MHLTINNFVDCSSFKNKTMKKLALLLLIFISSCSLEDEPKQMRLYDIQIVTEKEVRMYYTVSGGLYDIKKYMTEKSFAKRSLTQLNDIKKQYPAGTTTTKKEGVQFRTITIRTVTHNIK